MEEGIQKIKNNINQKNKLIKMQLEEAGKNTDKSIKKPAKPTPNKPK